MFGGLLILRKRGEEKAEVLSFKEFGLALDHYVKFEDDETLVMELYKKVWTKKQRRKWPRYQLIRATK